MRGGGTKFEYAHAALPAEITVIVASKLYLFGERVAIRDPAASTATSSALGLSPLLFHRAFIEQGTRRRAMIAWRLRLTLLPCSKRKSPPPHQNHQAKCAHAPRLKLNKVPTKPVVNSQAKKMASDKNRESIGHISSPIACC